MNPAREWTGHVVGKLTVLEREGSRTVSGISRSLWRCHCACGTTVRVTGKELGRKLALGRGVCGLGCSERRRKGVP